MCTGGALSERYQARCNNSFPKYGRIRKKAADAVGTVRCRRSLHGPRHGPTGTGLSSGIMPAPPVAAPATRAPDHLAAQLALGTRSASEGLQSYLLLHRPQSHDAAASLHSWVCVECTEEAALLEHGLCKSSSC